MEGGIWDQPEGLWDQNSSFFPFLLLVEFLAMPGGEMGNGEGGVSSVEFLGMAGMGLGILGGGSDPRNSWEWLEWDQER